MKKLQLVSLMSILVSIAAIGAYFILAEKMASSQFGTAKTQSNGATPAQTPPNTNFPKPPQINITSISNRTITLSYSISSYTEYGTTTVTGILIQNVEFGKPFLRV